MKSNNANPGDSENKVLDMTGRLPESKDQRRFKRFKKKLDLEQAKIAISTSILSVVVIATLANNNLMSKVTAQSASAGNRAIASVPTGTTDLEDHLVKELSKKTLSDSTGVGHSPSSLESLAFGLLEGKYSIRLQNGKISELFFSQNSKDQGTAPKQIDNPEKFLDAHRELLPVAFDKSLKVLHQAKDGGVTETYELVNRVSLPVAKVEFKLDAGGGLLGMRVVNDNAAQN
jgi:hypothetical protein